MAGELRDFAEPGGYGEVGFDGVGFGLTMAVGLGPVANQTIGTAGEFMWGGAASTIFWVDPAEELVVDLHDAARCRRARSTSAVS